MQITIFLPFLFASVNADTLDVQTAVRAYTHVPIGVMGAPITQNLNGPQMAADYSVSLGRQYAYEFPQICNYIYVRSAVSAPDFSIFV
jgi:hypothetical protein